MKLYHLAIGILLVVFAGCGPSIFNPIALEVDNASNVPIEVTIDTTTFQLEKHSSKLVYVKGGTMKVFAKNLTGEVLVDDSVHIEVSKEILENSYFMNVCHADYAIYYNFYSTKEDFTTADKYNWEVDGFTVKGARVDELNVRDQLIVKKDWDYRLSEEFPVEVEVYYAEGTWKTKLYRRNDLLEMFGINELKEPEEVLTAP